MAEQLVNFAWCTLTAGYTPGSGSVTVDSSGVGSGLEPFPPTGTFSIVIADSITNLPKALLAVTAVPDGTHFTVLTSGNPDDNACVTGDVAYAVFDKRALLALIAALAPSGMKHLQSQTASGAAQLDFSSWYDSAYDHYVILFEGLVPSVSGAAMGILYSTDGGMTYDTSSIYDYAGNYSAVNGTSGNVHGTEGGVSVSPITSDPHYPLFYRVELFNPGSTTAYKLSVVMWMFGHTSIGAAIMGQYAWWYKNAAAVNAFRVKPSSGTFSGTVRVFGLSH